VYCWKREHIIRHTYMYVSGLAGGADHA